MRTRSRILIAVLAASSLVVGACSDDDDAAPSGNFFDRAGPVDRGDTGVIQLSALDADSPYVQGLCTIDFFDPGDEEDPMGWVIDELRQLPTSTPAESQEVDWMIERIERSETTDDPLATDDLTSVAAVLRARCS